MEIKDINILLLTGGGDPYHNFDEIAESLKLILSDKVFKLNVSDDLDELLPGKIKNYDVIMCNMINVELSPLHERSLLDAIIGSPWNNTGKAKGFIGLHGASFTFLNSPDYINMLGGRFLTHPEIANFTYRVKNENHEIMQGVSDFNLESELYLMESKPPFEVLLSCEFQGFERPIAWVKPYGLGRVFYLALGHNTQEFDCKAVQKMILNSVYWAAN